MCERESFCLCLCLYLCLCLCLWRVCGVPVSMSVSVYLSARARAFVCGSSSAKCVCNFVSVCLPVSVCLSGSVCVSLCGRDEGLGEKILTSMPRRLQQLYELWRGRRVVRGGVERGGVSSEEMILTR